MHFPKTLKVLAKIMCERGVGKRMMILNFGLEYSTHNFTAHSYSSSLLYFFCLIIDMLE